MKKSFVYVTLLLMGVLASCGKEHSNEIDLIVPFYQNLGVEYDMTANKTYAGANFNKQDSAGANLKLPAGAVLINGEEPLFENIGVYFYKASFDGLQNVTFTFNRSKEQVFVNKASTSRVTSHPLQQSNGSAGGKIDVSYTISKKVAIQ